MNFIYLFLLPNISTMFGLLKYHTIMNRTQIDFSKHEVFIERSENLLVHYLKIPNSYTNSIKFINTNGILAVTGDFGNWIFCREFHPSADGRVSSVYWCEKLINSSCQQPYEFDSESTEKELNRMLNGGIEEYGWSGKEADDMKEYFEECLSLVDDDFGYKHFAYREYPSFTDTESVVYIQKPQVWLQTIFDGFDHICLRIKSKLEILTTP